MNQDIPPPPKQPDFPVVARATGELVHLNQPRTASEAFLYLSTRAAEHALELQEHPAAGGLTSDQWASISSVLKVLSDFSTPLDSVVSARHVRWAYGTVLRRLPESGSETGPLVHWLSRVPTCAADKAAPAALLFHYLAHCCGMHAEAMPIPKGKPNEWFLQKAGGLIVPLTNEEAYGIGQQRHFWGTVYRPRLLHLQGVLLKEMCGLEDATMMQAVAKAQEAAKGRAAVQPDPKFAEPEAVSQAAVIPMDVVAPQAQSAEIPATSLGELSEVDLSK